MPKHILGSLTWDQGTKMARHAALTVGRGTNENTNGLIREYLPKGTDITDHQPYLNAIADKLNDRPRTVLGFLTPAGDVHEATGRAH